MKRRLLAFALLGVAATMGAANAAPLTSNSVEIWSAETMGDASTSLRQQGLPTASGLFSGGSAQRFTANYQQPHLRGAY